MKSSARRNDQLSLGPMEVGNSEGADPILRNSENGDPAVRNAEDDRYAVSAELFDAALNDPRANLTNKEVAHLVGVSESLVQKWRTPSARTCPSFVQLLRLPPAFHLALHRSMNRRFGFGRAALVDLLEAVGSLALVTER